MSTLGPFLPSSLEALYPCPKPSWGWKLSPEYQGEGLQTRHEAPRTKQLGNWRSQDKANSDSQAAFFGLGALCGVLRAVEPFKGLGLGTFGCSSVGSTWLKFRDLRAFLE